MNNKTTTIKEFYECYEGNYNLYIIRDKDVVLYVGISKSNIWDRWWGNTACHIYTNIYGEWGGNSPIGIAVQKNLPESLDWTVELRCYEDLMREEERIIKELNPIFNTSLRYDFTYGDNVLYYKYMKKNVKLVEHV